MTIDEIAERVIGCCFKVHRILGEGFLEKVYENALMIELRSQGLQAQQQPFITVRYLGQPVGEYFADILVENCLVCELKANLTIAREHESPAGQLSYGHRARRRLADQFRQECHCPA